MADNRLISAFSRFLPDMKATFSIFDQPQIYLSWARRGSLVDLGLRGESESEL
jgi:beta-1,2-xylosyltransferase